MNYKALFLAVTCLAVAACREDGGHGGGAGTAPTPPPPVSGDVTISGAISFDLVPINTATDGLDYDNMRESPARGITVEAVDGSGTVLASDVSNASGQYSVTVNSNTQVRIRALAQMISTNGAQWDVEVVDNTSSDSLYALQGGLMSSGTGNSTRNLNADSGWGGTSYTGTRAAGPFAILNPIYDALQKVVAVDPDVNLPAVDFNWSPQNTSATIGTSFYSQGDIFVLGGENEDTDEYDDHVIVHEWGHYFEDNLSRSDSIGGAHSGGDRLDPRVAFGEGFGNALSGMITDDPVYRDSNGTGQASGFSINVESNNHSPEGWYNEGSVQSILYDIYDTAADGSDNIAAGFGPIYNTLISDAYKTSEYFTSIFLFADQFKAQNSGESAGVNALLSAQSIDGSGPDGAGETNSGGITNALPIYKDIVSNGPVIEICSLNDAGTFNKLGVHTFLELVPGVTGTHTLSMIKQAGQTATLDPDFVVYNAGAIDAIGESETADAETVTATLQAGVTYIIDAYEFTNFDGAGGDYCYDFTVTN